MNWRLIFSEENIPNYSLDGCLEMYTTKAKEMFGFGLKKAAILGHGFVSEFFVSEEEIEANQELEEEYLFNRDKFLSLLKKVNESISLGEKGILTLSKLRLNKLSNIQLWDEYQEYIKSHEPMLICYSFLEPYRMEIIEKKVMEFIKRKKVSDPAHVLSVLTGPLVSIKPKRFLNFINKSFNESLSEDAKIMVKCLGKSFEEEKNSNPEKDKLLQEIPFSEKEKHILHVLSVLSTERLKLRYSWMPSIYYLETFILEFKRRTGLKKEIIRFYTQNELKELIINDRKVPQSEIIKRKEGLLRIYSSGKIREGTSQEKRDILKKEQHLAKRSSVQGMVASKGHVFGKALILSYKKPEEHAVKIKNMSGGDIIITEMTRPNIIPACENAGGIITDEGGVLSHAAIVSRELNIPCLIGTKDATSIFKDGDFVEINTLEGNARIIDESTFKKNFILHKRTKRKNLLVKDDYSKLKLGDIFWFNEINLKDIPTVGGKGASLGELSSITGITVPLGFCVSVNAYKKFLEENEIISKIKEILDSLRIDSFEILENGAEKIRRLILDCTFPEEIEKNVCLNYQKMSKKDPIKVAVRSSATAEDLPGASFAGQQDTYLNIKGEKSLIDAVKKCWASLFTARAIYYREKNHFAHDKVLISVVVQEMVDVEYAGVIFTKDPLEKKGILIEVVKGVGEKLVSGEVTPNNYLLDKTGKIKKKKEVFAFPESTVKKLAELSLLIEKHYKKPQDIEWAIDKKGKIFFLQSRPITT
jgi:phosphoenolpyruvate synthase/pyruvate phosphate dikinase